MLLVAGGQHDPNIEALVRRLTQRDLRFHDLRIGADANPHIRIDLTSGQMALDGTDIRPSAGFLRHDVFLFETENVAAAAVAALNWYQALRGWLASQPQVRLFNRQFPLRETDKIGNLIAARDCGLAIPPTVIDSGPVTADAFLMPRIQKPAAGGAYTVPLDEHWADDYPRFIQPRLDTPETRIFRVGPRLLAFRILSPELDYRRTSGVRLCQIDPPKAEGAALLRLCDRLDLQFAAADFMTGPDGELVFLEVNSQPMFAAFDRVSEGALCDAIIDALLPCLQADNGSAAPA